MAQFYQGPHFWDRRTYEVTVKTSWYVDRHEWVAEMIEWAHQRSIKIEWSGESTHSTENKRWHEAHFYIPDERDRVAFALRWA